MGIFKGFADSSFATDLRGRHLFYPWGSGRGYVIPDRETYRELRAEIIRLNMIYLTPVYVLLVMEPLLGLALFAAYSFSYYDWVRDETRYWRAAEDKLTLHQSLENSVTSYGIPTLFLLLAFFSFIMTEIIILMHGAFGLIDFMFLLFFGGFVFLAAYMIHLYFRPRKN